MNKTEDDELGDEELSDEEIRALSEGLHLKCIFEGFLLVFCRSIISLWVLLENNAMMYTISTCTTNTSHIIRTFSPRMVY